VRVERGLVRLAEHGLRLIDQAGQAGYLGVGQSGRGRGAGWRATARRPGGRAAGRDLPPRAGGRVLRGYLVSAGVLALALVIALFVMRVSRADLSGAGPAPEPAGDASSPNLA
jgi:hypothetical protein